jgi:Na+/H+ antiporter NhaD/arsenite permease-like protein
MRVAAIWIGALALWIGTLSLLLWLWTGAELAPALLTGAAVALAAIAAFVATLRDEDTGPRTLTESSLPTVVVVIGVAMMVNGLTFGLFLILIGAEVAALGVAGLARQLWLERRGRG